jgi:hypothetical protein
MSKRNIYLSELESDTIFLDMLSISGSPMGLISSILTSGNDLTSLSNFSFPPGEIFSKFEVCGGGYWREIEENAELKGRLNKERRKERRRG